MKRKLIATISCVMAIVAVKAQNLSQGDSLKFRATDSLRGSLNNEDYQEGWNQNGNMNIGFAQSHLENWAAGGEVNALNINGLLNGYKTKKSGRALWENTYYASYGLMYNQSNNFVPRKTDDRLDLATKYGIQMKKNPKWYWAGLMRLQTQFSAGFNYSDSVWRYNGIGNPISEFFSPAYITLALGAEYKPHMNFNWFISPVAARLTFVKEKYTTELDTDSNGAFGVSHGNTSRVELGAYSTMNWFKPLAKNITYRTRLDLYMDYLDPKGFGLVDVLWDNTIAMKVNEYIGMSFGFTIVYDNDVPGQQTYNADTQAYEYVSNLGWVQLKQIFNVGFAYQF